MNRIVSILMKRDGMERSEAEELFSEVKQEVIDAAESGDYDLAQELLESDLGLEPDYMVDLLM